MRYRADFIDDDEKVLGTAELRAECAEDAVAEGVALPCGARERRVVEVWEISVTASWDRRIGRYAAAPGRAASSRTVGDDPPQVAR